MVGATMASLRPTSRAGAAGGVEFPQDPALAVGASGPTYIRPSRVLPDRSRRQHARGTYTAKSTVLNLGEDAQLRDGECCALRLTRLHGGRFPTAVTYETRLQLLRRCALRADDAHQQPRRRHRVGSGNVGAVWTSLSGRPPAGRST